MVEFWLPIFRPGVGVSGKGLVHEGESRLAALVRGRNMPAPGVDVVK